MMNLALVVLDVPIDCTHVSDSGTMAAKALDVGKVYTSRGRCKIVQVVGDTLGAAVVDLDGERIRVERSHGLVGVSICSGSAGDKGHTEPECFESRVFANNGRDTAEKWEPPTEAARDVGIVWLLKGNDPKYKGHEEDVGGKNKKVWT